MTIDFLTGSHYTTNRKTFKLIYLKWFRLYRAEISLLCTSKESIFKMETVEERLDFRHMTINRYGITMPIASARFPYWDFPNRNNRSMVEVRAYQVIKPALEQYVSDRKKEGWELIDSLDKYRLENQEGVFVPPGLIALSCFLLIGFILAFLFIFITPNNYVLFTGTTLRFRRA